MERVWESFGVSLFQEMCPTCRTTSTNGKTLSKDCIFTTLPYWSIQLCEFLDCKLYSISTATATGRNKTVPKVQWTWALSAFANNLIPSYDLSTNCERESYLYQSSLETAVIRSFNLWKIQAMIGLRSVKNIFTFPQLVQSWAMQAAWGGVVLHLDGLRRDHQERLRRRGIHVPQYCTRY